MFVATLILVVLGSIHVAGFKLLILSAILLFAVTRVAVLAEKPALIPRPNARSTAAAPWRRPLRPKSGTDGSASERPSLTRSGRRTFRSTCAPG